MKREGPTDLTTAPRNRPRLVQGPLPKSSYTQLLEKAIKQIIVNFDGVKIKNSSGKILIKIDKKYFDLVDLLQHSNFSHLVLDDKDYDNLYKMLINQNGISDKTKALFKQDGYEDYLFHSLMKLYAENNRNTKEKLIDSSFHVYSLPHFYNMIREPMKGNISDFLNEGKITEISQARLKLSLIHAGVICCGLHERLNFCEKLTRTEKFTQLTANESKARDLCVKGDIPYVQAKTMISTSMGERTCEEVKVYFDHGVGADISGESFLPHEREFLMIPSQLQYYRKVTQGKTVSYYARPINTPEGLSDKERGKVDPRPVRNFLPF